jgi:hypothetical protein
LKREEAKISNGGFGSGGPSTVEGSVKVPCHTRTLAADAAVFMELKPSSAANASPGSFDLIDIGET